MSNLSFAVISCSLDPDSHSYLLAEQARLRLSAANCSVTLVDLREAPLPAFDDCHIYTDERLRCLIDIIRAADGVLLAVPVYNWAVGSAAKNMIEATGSNDFSRALISPWFDKIVAFLVSGGIPESYTAHMALAGSLMLDFKCVINPYHVFTTSRDWTNAQLSEKASKRLDKTLQVTIELAEALRNRNYRSRFEI